MNTILLVIIIVILFIIDSKLVDFYREWKATLKENL